MAKIDGPNMKMNWRLWVYPKDAFTVTVKVSGPNKLDYTFEPAVFFVIWPILFKCPSTIFTTKSIIFTKYEVFCI